MKKLVLVLLGGGLLIAILGIAWMQNSRPSTSPLVSKPTAPPSVSEKAATPRALAAKYPVQAGALLRAQDFHWVELGSEHDASLNDLFLENFSQLDALEGSLITRHQHEAQLLNVNDIIRPEQSHYVSAMLAPGKRAVTLELTQAGVSHGLLRPGNWVDVVLTNESYAESGSTPKYAATTVLEGVRLLAIGAVVTEFIAKQPVENVGNPNSYEPVRVTFEVSPSDAKHLLLAQRLGVLSLILRSQFEADLAEMEEGAVLWDEQVSESFNPGSIPRNTVRIFDGETERDRQPKAAN
ncbi:Flp pilus assembly protein CpaB [Vibrio tarriae]|uniref:Flp pilus assembly protein CpaB n=1 Tax=Vibrio tarriae TaxID=2014742 RepID=A0AAU8WL35_9VIBR|nr:Flp pilus assembly protein CpaB [Vibrio tarriae]QEO44656.1 Flp pilus assembly protein CpaB [Vibrio cholerae]ASK56614.1 Flp pilus assembly protein CpaB [Vibrio tarriae]RBM24970.1 Flp pilus assembly protein CpaB [Vibrio tarriae]RBM31966.1 Flp pilus assembly protein CpaB [Vibrio tarriae]RBM42734.1 Flp pilus assembly protein CpaB [Vibrio tarriae]